MSSVINHIYEHTLALSGFVSLTIAILLLFIGKGVVARTALMREYGIPESMVGGLLCAILVCVLHYTISLDISFELDARDDLLLYFFAALGLSSNIRQLPSGGKYLVLLLLLSTIFIILQNSLGMMMASLFGMDPHAGLLVGSISLTGGVGTTLAWAPHFEGQLGIDSASELGIAANMVGMVSACFIGGPIASWLMRRHSVKPSADSELEVGKLFKKELTSQLDYYGVLLAIFWLNIALILGSSISELIKLTDLNLPAFVGCLIAGILLRSVGDLLLPDGGRLWRFNEMKSGIALISDISLGLFITMAIMGLQLWEIQPILGFITVTMSLQIILTILFTVFLVFRLMGRDYEATVVCSGFGGIALGSTATAVANMTAVSRQYGAAPRAFLIVPLVCGFFIDLINALIIGLMSD